ncbi:MAG: pilus assembly protein N-terminal domain-containing protein [Planctomycetes bacterium]|nr:pilus assembly protein N-terminal domain-containing protein [Planctomycetota bacterium]
MIGTAVSPGDIVDVLVMLKEHGDAAKDIKMETLFESLTVFESAEASLGSCTNVKVLAEKEIVGDLLLAGNKGLLRLIVHRPPIQRNAFPVYQGDSTPTFPQGTRMIYRDNGTWGPADAPIQASGVQSPQPASPRERPKSEVQQVLEEVREMRKLIQGLREDMNALRNSVGSKSKRETSQRTDLLISKGQSQTMTRTKRIIRVDGFDPKILAVLPVKPNSLRLLGRGLGRTTVEVWFEGDAEESEKVVVEVAPDIPVQRPTTGVAPPKAADHEPVFTRTIKRGTPSKPIAAPRGPHTELRVALNHSHLLKRDKKFTRIAVAAPEVADFVQYSLQEAGIIGQKPGSTDLTIWYEGDPVPETFEIVVVGPSGDDDPFSSTGSKEEDAARRQIEQALKKSISIDMTDGTLKDALKQLHQTAGVNIAIDSAALEDEGVTTDVKVSLHLSGVSLRAALKILLSPFNLTTLIEDEVLKVTSQVRAKGSLIAVVYQVKDLTQTEKDGKADFDSLIELITTVVEPDSWQEVGGMGAIAPNPTTSSLVVRQTQDAHEEIQELFSALRKWNSGVAPVQFDSGQKQSFFKPASHRKGTFPVYGPRPTRNGMIPHPVKNPLNRTISVSFEDDTLKDVLSYLATALDVQLSIDQAALEEEGITERQVVSINVDDIMAKSALNLILEPLSLGAVLEGGKTLRVTSLSQLKSRQTVRVYPVKHLLADPDIIDMKKLTEMITISVEPDSWQALGGDATLTPNEKTKSLVIRQSRETHEKIRVLLEDLNDLVVTPGGAATKAGPQKTASPNGKDTTEKTAEEISPDIGVPIDIPRRKSTR